jgi:hypothetical protein
MASEEQQKLMTWLSRCSAVAGSASYIINGYPETQVGVLKLELKAAAAAGVDWREIYGSIYEEWHTRRPLFPDPETMAAQMKQNR